MIYAESDFFLALIKSSDWLKKNAERLANEYRGKIVTSIATLIEVLIVGQRLQLDEGKIVNSIYSISEVEGLEHDNALQIARLIKKNNFTVLDAFHAVLSRDRKIITSDKAYDMIGKERIPLETQ